MSTSRPDLSRPVAVAREPRQVNKMVIIPVNSGGPTRHFHSDLFLHVSSLYTRPVPGLHHRLRPFVLSGVS